ncbi:unnamed protein product [Urochloa decumbens]|uniref:F-box domain-containing protein n=1 Tax=Urochloa decumbens TaxID=240449 RepID=A0ABC8WC27_9POAL
MASQQAPPPRWRMLPPAHREVPSSTTTIHELEENLILEIFLRLSLPSLVRAAVSCRAFLAAVRSSPVFRRRFHALHPPLSSASFSIPRAPTSPPLLPSAAAPTQTSTLPVADHGVPPRLRPPYQLENPAAGRLQSNHRGPGSPPPAARRNERRLPWQDLPNKFLLAHIGCLSDEPPRTFRVVCVCHGKSMMRSAIFSSGTGDWQILPRWSPNPLMAQPSTRKYCYCLHSVTQVNGSLYWSYDKQAYQLVLDTATLQFNFTDLPEHLKGQGTYMTGETKHGKPCIVSAEEFTLSVWFRRANADGVEKWMLDSVIPLEEEVLQATEGSRDDHLALEVGEILDGVVYLSTSNRPGFSCWFLSFCLETRKLEKLFNKTFDNSAYPYIMAWPPSLVGNNVNP